MLSVIVPTLNEADNLGPLLDRLAAAPGIGEVIVVDGGSTDGTPDLVKPPARVIDSEPGRGIQLRAGAAAASGDTFLFLHADVISPTDVATQVEAAIRLGCVGGNFRLRYPNGGLLGYWIQTLAPLYRGLGRYYGDSGIFVRRDVYEAAGGFPHVPIMEDVIFVRRLERMGRTAYLSGPMKSSTRRFRKRPVRTLLLWGAMQTLFALGVSPWKLSRFYRPPKP